MPGRPAPSVLFVFEHLAGVGGRDGVPALPGDVKDDGGYDEADDRVGQVKPERDDGGAGEHAEADEAVDAGVVAVGDEGRTRESPPGAQPDLGGDLVADEADDPCGGKQPQVREAARMDEALDRLAERDESTDKDREHDEEPGEPLGAEGTKEEGEPERERGESVTIAPWAAAVAPRMARLIATVLTPSRERKDRAVDETVRVPVPIAL